MSDFGSLISILFRSTLRNAAYLFFNGALILLVLLGAYMLRESRIAEVGQDGQPQWPGLLMALSKIMIFPSLLVALAMIDSVFLSESLLRKDSDVSLLHFSTLELSLSYSVFCLLIWATRTAILLGIGYLLGSAVRGVNVSSSELLGLISFLLLICAIGLPLVSILVPLMWTRPLEIAVVLLFLTSIPLFLGEGLDVVSRFVQMRDIVTNIAPLSLLLLLSFLISLVVFSVWIRLRKGSALKGFLATEKDRVGNQSKA